MSFLHFSVNAVGVNLDLEAGSQREEGRETEKTAYCNKMEEEERQVGRDQTESKTQRKGVTLL